MAGKTPGASVKFDSDKLRSMIEDRWPDSRASFARSCGIHPATFSKMLIRGTCNVDMLYRLAHGLKMPESMLMDKVVCYKNKPHAYRVRANMSIDQLSKKSGISAESISHVENGRDCFVFNAYCLAQVFGVSIGQYMGYEE